MNILVTGANGQLGLEIRKIIDKIGNGHPDHSSDEKNYYIFAGHNDLDITNRDSTIQYVKDNKINVVINCAAYTAVDKAEDDYEAAYNINAIGPKNLADAVKSVGAVLLHISTDYVFNGLKNGYYEESDETSPLGVYGSTKRDGESEIMKSGCYYIIFRTSWLYGGDKKNFVKTMFNLLKDGKDVKVVNDQFGNPTYCYDLASFLVSLIENNDSINRNLSHNGIFNFSNLGTTSWYMLTDSIRFFMKKNGLTKIGTVTPCSTSEYPTRAKRPHNSAFDLNKLKDTFDYYPKYWKDSLESCIKKYIEENGTQTNQL